MSIYIFYFCKSESMLFAGCRSGYETHKPYFTCTDLDLVAAAEVGPEAEAVWGQRRQGGGLALKPCRHRRRRWRRAVPFRLPIGREILPRQRRRRQILSPLVIKAAAAAGLFAKAFRLELRHNLPLWFKSKYWPKVNSCISFQLVVFILLKILWKVYFHSNSESQKSCAVLYNVHCTVRYLKYYCNWNAQRVGFYRLLGKNLFIILKEHWCSHGINLLFLIFFVQFTVLYLH